MADSSAAFPKLLWIGPEGDRDKFCRGFTTRYVDNFSQAAEIMESNDSDIIILNLTEAHRDDIHLLLKSRQRPVDAQVLGLLRRDASMLNEAIRSGINDFIMDPIREDEFQGRLNMAQKRLRSTRSYRKASGHLVENSLTMQLPTDRQIIIPVADMLTRDLHPRGQATEEQAFHIRLTLSEVLANAVEHGSLEISLDEKIKALEDGTFEDLFDARMADPRLAERMITVSMNLTPDQVSYTIQDQGPGFDVSALMEELSEPKPDLPCGRGLYLIRHFMDHFEYSDNGRRVVLVKYLKPLGG